jgi:integrase
MSMVSMAPGHQQMSLPADSGTDVPKRESNPSEYFAAAAPRNRIRAEVLQSSQAPIKLSARFAEFPSYCLSGATASAFGAATEPSSTYTEKILEQGSAASDGPRAIGVPEDPVYTIEDSAKTVSAEDTTDRLPGDTLQDVAEILIRRRTKDQNWDVKTARQAKQIYALFARYLDEIHHVVNLSDLRQKHLAAFAHFLQFGIYKHHGKSIHDDQRSIAEMREIARLKPVNLRGVETPTLNRHLGFLQQLLEFAPAQGVEIDRSLTTRGLRARAPKDRRDRDARVAMTAAQTKALFDAPCFTGCASWDRPTQAGPYIYHRALFWLPMLIYYSGARREEICGLLVDDVLMGGNIPYLRLVPNKYRRLKNAQSQRDIPIHPELIRLGFLDYAEAVRALGYDLLFADLYSPTSRSPLGDRLCDELKPVLRVAGVAAEGGRFIRCGINSGTT